VTRTEFVEALSRSIFRSLMGSRLPADTDEADALIEAFIRDDEEVDGYDELSGSYQSFCAAADALFSEYDVDGSGLLSPVEYLTVTLRDTIARASGRAIDLFRSMATGHGMRSGSIAGKSKAADADDRFADAAKPPPPGIEREDFRRGITSLGVAAPDATLDALFDAWDADGSERLELDELKRLLQMDSAAAASLRRALRTPAGRRTTRRTAKRASSPRADADE